MNELLTVEEVAKELNTQPVNVKRLIARRKLDAARLGATDQWRVTREALSKYTQAGLQDFVAPSHDEHWFTDNFNFVTSQFEAKLLGAANAQRLSEAQIEKIATATKPEEMAKADVHLEMSPAMFMVCEEAPPVRLPDDKKRFARFKSQLEVFIVANLQSEARYVKDPRKLPMSLATLYRSPEDYQAIVEQSAASFDMRNLLFTESRVAFEGTQEMKHVRVTYLLKKQKLWNASLRSQMIALAF